MTLSPGFGLEPFGLTPFGGYSEDSSALVRAYVAGEGWRTVPLTGTSITRVNPDLGGWNTEEITTGLIRVFKNGMWQTVQYPESGD